MFVAAGPIGTPASHAHIPGPGTAGAQHKPHCLPQRLGTVSPSSQSIMGTLLKSKFLDSSPGRGLRGASLRTAVSGPLCQLFSQFPKKGHLARALEVREIVKGPRRLQPSRGLFPAPDHSTHQACGAAAPAAPPQFPALPIPAQALPPFTVSWQPWERPGLHQPAPHSDVCCVRDWFSLACGLLRQAGSSFSLRPFPPPARSRHALISRDLHPAGAQQPSCVGLLSPRVKAGTALGRSRPDEHGHL